MHFALRAILLTPAAALAAADDAPLVLRPSLELTIPAIPATGEERALLRLEWRAALSATDEKLAVDEIYQRVQRANDTCAEIRRILTAIPDGRTAATTAPIIPPPEVPAAAPQTAAAPAIAETVATEAAGEDDSWLAPIMAAGLALLAAGFWWQRRRNARLAETELAATVMMPERHASAPIEPPAEHSVQATWPPETFPAAGPSTETGETAHRLADTMMAIGLTESAARSLENHIRSHPRRALSHWLRLLDLYRQSGLRAEFDQAAERLNRQYNVSIQEWLQAANDSHLNSLERFPHIRTRLTALWPSEECAAYLQQLLDDNRDGTRTGFERTVVDEILLLQGLLKQA